MRNLSAATRLASAAWHSAALCRLSSRLDARYFYSKPATASCARLVKRVGQSVRTAPEATSAFWPSSSRPSLPSSPLCFSP